MFQYHCFALKFCHGVYINSFFLPFTEQEKLRDFQYPSVESFYYDFSLLFQNILQYFPNNHPAYAKAYELSLHFEKQWELAKLTLK